MIDSIRSSILGRYLGVLVTQLIANMACATDLTPGDVL
jgi:hypothetical protein